MSHERKPVYPLPRWVDLHANTFQSHVVHAGPNERSLNQKARFIQSLQKAQYANININHKNVRTDLLSPQLAWFYWLAGTLYTFPGSLCIEFESLPEWDCWWG